MKNFTKSLRIIFLSVAILLAVQSNSFAVLYSINNAMSGAQENPPVAGGSGNITGTYNSATKVISYTVTFSVTGTTTAAHFHGPAAVGVNAGVQIGYAGFPLGVSSGSYTNTNTLTVTQETQLLSGLWYSNVHTTTFGGGAIRGQITPIALRTMDLTYLIQGLYNDVTNLMVSDTVRVILRSTVSPYPAVDSAKVKLNTAGNNALIGFANAVNGTQYYIQMLHRNALETYNGASFSFTANAGSYEFVTSNTLALGNNLILKGSRYCAYSGDLDHNGFIELSDILEIANDANNFATGYLPTDLDGDNNVGLSDLLICSNNASNFVTAVVP